MKTGTNSRNRQGGAVAIIVGFSLVLLIGFLALVIDLGHLYIAKTGLQNAADAAALSGAKQLDGTGARICCGSDSAAALAIATAGRNTFFGSDAQEKVVITADNVWVSTVPNPDTDSDSNTAWVPVMTAKDVANNNYYFIKVDTASRNLKTWFAPIWNIFTTSTFGVAVAGWEIVNVAPIGICAIDPTDTDDSDGSYYGFDRGIAYDLAKVNDLLLGLGKGTPLWLHPTAMTQEQCKEDVSFASRSKFSPFLCLGESAAGRSQYVYANTGWEAAQEGAINTRFRSPGDTQDSKFSGMSAQLCAPDMNVNEFSRPQETGPGCSPSYCSSFITKSACNGEPEKVCQWDNKNGVCLRKAPPSAGCDTDVDWLTYIPTQQGATLTLTKETPPRTLTDAPGQSVIATYIKPVDTSVLNPAIYPATSPYQAGIDGTTKYYAAPYTATGVTPTKGRRLINIVIVNCSTGLRFAGVCEELPKLGVGQFFMPVKADLNSVNKAVYLEFVRKMPTFAESARIRLFQSVP